MPEKDRGELSRAYAAATAFAAIIGFSFMFVKLGLESADPVDMLAHRFTIAYAAAALWFAAGKRTVPLSGQKLRRLWPLALLYPVLFFAFQVFGLVYTSSSEAGVIQAAVPIFTLLMAALFLKERASVRQTAAVLLSVAGILYIMFSKGARFESADALGAILILASALCFAGYNVVVRRFAGQYGTAEMSYIMTFFGFVCFNAIAVVRRAAEGTLDGYFAAFGSPVFILSILYLGVLSSLGTSLLSNYALARLEAARVGVFANLATIITMAAGVWFLGERLGVEHYVGAAMVVAGAIGVNWRVGAGKKQGKRTASTVYVKEE